MISLNFAIPQLDEEFFHQMEAGLFRRIWRVHESTPAPRLIEARNRLFHAYVLHHKVEWPPLLISTLVMQMIKKTWRTHEQLSKI